MLLQKLRPRKSQKGFTLIELMIVIAIIGILAAIAVPQFLAYRIRSYNSAAKAVAHNVKADEGNLNAELGLYGHTEEDARDLADTNGTTGPADTNAANGDAGLRVAATATVAGARLYGTGAGGRIMAVPIALGDNMTCLATDTAGDPDSFIIMAKHFKGDTAYGLDSDIENVLYTVSNPEWVQGDGLEAADDTLVATDNNDDFVGIAGGGAPTTQWTAAP